MSTETTWSLACGDVVPGCPTVFTGKTQDEVLAQIAPHAAEAHGLTEIDAQTREAVIAAMREVPAAS